MPNINTLVVDMGGLEVKLSDYKGKPILVLDGYGDNGFMLGISKAKTILKGLDKLQAYVKHYDQLVPKQAKQEPKVNTNSFKNVAWAKNLINA